MNKLENPPRDYISSVFVNGDVRIAVSIRGEVVIYNSGGRRATQLGQIASAVLVNKYLWVVNDEGVLVLDIDNLEVFNKEMTGGEHIGVGVEGGKGGGYVIVIAKQDTLFVYIKEKLMQEINVMGKITSLTFKDTILLISVVNSSQILTNKVFKFINEQFVFDVDTSPGFGYPLVTQSCIVTTTPHISYIQSSMEGKVAISTIGGESFVFRPHKKTLTDKSLLAQPVLAIANRANILVTGGDDILGIWDISTKKRNSQIKNIGGIVTALAIDESRIVVAVGDGGVKNSDLQQDLNLSQSQLFEMSY